MLLALEKMGACEAELMNSSLSARERGQPGRSQNEVSFQKLGVSSDVAPRLGFLKDSCTVLLVESEYEEKRVHALIQVVNIFSTYKVNVRTYAKS